MSPSSKDHLADFLSRCSVGQGVALITAVGTIVCLLLALSFSLISGIAYSPLMIAVVALLTAAPIAYILMVRIDRLRSSERISVENKSRLSTIVEISALPVIIARQSDGVMLYATPRAGEWLKYPIDRLPKSSLLGHYFDPPEAAETFVAEVRQAERVVDLEVRMKTAEGDPIWASVSAVLRDFEGQQAVYATFRDITEQKRVNDRLSALNDTLQAMIQASPLAVIVLNEEGLIQLWNPAAGEIFGWSTQEVLGRSAPTLTEFNLPEFLDLHRRVLRGGGVDGVTLRRQRKDGARIDLTVWMAPLHDAQQRVVSNLALVSDITEQKKAEEALQTSQDSLSRAQQIAHIGNWEQNLDTGELTFSEEAYRIFGRSKATFRPSLDTFYQSVHPDDRDTIRAAFREAIATRRPYHSVHRVIRPNGTERFVRQHAEFTCDSTGRAIRASGTVQDITEFKQLEEQLRQSQKMEAVGRLAGGIAHDFNNLLTVIHGYSQLLLMAVDTEETRHGYAEQILEAGERAAALTRQLLAFSRKQVLQPKVMDVNAVVGNMDSMLRRLIGGNIAFFSMLSPRLAKIRADKSQLEQVVMNLVVNARDAMPTGGELIIETSNLSLLEADPKGDVNMLPGEYVMLAVKDTGMGIQADVLPHIFEPFFTTKDVNKGTGLGLSTVYGIIHQSGGYVTVETKPEHGTTFRAFLPAVLEPVDIAPLTPQPALSYNGETILVVEDEPGVRSLIRTILEESGYTVLAAERGKEALELLSKAGASVRLMVTDVVMPEMSGRELADRLAETHPSIKVLYLSGYTNDQIGHDGVIDQGMSFLQKPFLPEMLIRKVGELLSP